MYLSRGTICQRNEKASCTLPRELRNCGFAWLTNNEQERGGGGESGGHNTGLCKSMCELIGIFLTNKHEREYSDKSWLYKFTVYSAFTQTHTHTCKWMMLYFIYMSYLFLFKRKKLLDRVEKYSGNVLLSAFTFAKWYSLIMHYIGHESVKALRTTISQSDMREFRYFKKFFTLLKHRGKANNYNMRIIVPLWHRENEKSSIFYSVYSIACRVNGGSRAEIWRNLTMRVPMTRETREKDR